MAVRPPVCAATAPDAEIFRSLRRVMRAMISPCHLLFVGIARSPTCAARGVVLPTRGFMAEASSRSALGRDGSREYTDLMQTAAQSATARSLWGDGSMH